MTGISYDSEDAARVAEICLSAGCGEAIPHYLRRGVLPEVLERELCAPAPTKPTGSAASDRLIADQLAEAAAERFRQQRGA